MLRVQRLPECSTLPSYPPADGQGSRALRGRDPVRAVAHYVTMRDGGFGAVRELAEVILSAQSRLRDSAATATIGAAVPSARN